MQPLIIAGKGKKCAQCGKKVRDQKPVMKVGRKLVLFGFFSLSLVSIILFFFKVNLF